MLSAMSSAQPSNPAASSALLDINVDQLFEQHTIVEIAQVHKQLQSDVEHKKEELRTMVGERYRDLLKAADTIGEMRTTATAVIGHIDDISATCRRLNEQQLIGFRNASGTPTHQQQPSTTVPPPPTTTLPLTPAERAVRQFHGLGVQIKLLAALPELIWSRMDCEDYFVATQLFALSRHISTGLQLDMHRPMMRHFPVARQLWVTIAPFHHSIRQACLAALGRRDLDTAVAAKCLASLLLLESTCTAERLLGTLIQLRGRTFSETLADGNGKSGEGGETMRIQDRVLASLDVLLATLRLIGECFVDGAVRAEVDGLQDGSSAPATIELMGLTDAVFRQRVPEIIATYR